MAEESEQPDEDRRQTAFQRVITQAQPAPGELHRLLLLNLTTKPPMDYRQLALSWMQRAPARWPGYHPEQCANVDRME